MSVNTSEEYLDELLDAIEPIIRMGEPDVPEISEMSDIQEISEPIQTAEISEIPAFEPEPEYEPVEIKSVEEEAESGKETIDEEGASAISDLLSSLAAEEEDIIDESVMSEEDIESMLNAVSSQTVSEESDVSYDEDVKELLKQFTEDEDLSDIQDILDKNDNGEALDNSLFDLPDVEVFQLEEESEDAEETDKIKKVNPITKLIGGLSGLFKKRKNIKDNASEEVPEQEEVPTQEESNTVFADQGETEEQYLETEEQGLDLADVDGLDLEELLGEDVDDLVFDEDMSDIEQLLSGGAFAEIDEVQEEKATIEDTETSGNSKKSKKKERKERKERKEKNKKDKVKKESIFTKVLNALTEELDEPAGAVSDVPEAGETVVTEENLNILEELSAEDKKKAKQAKKEEKQKKKAEKKGKNAPKKGESDGNEEDSDDKKSKKSKKPKKKREKKEKPRKVEEITKPEKKLPKKRVMSTFALCFSILAAILILQNVVFKSDNLKEAKYAFDNGDYATCFANLETVERDEEEEDLYQKSLIILSVQRKWDAYNNFVAMDDNLEALNSLLEGVAVYRSQEETALEWGVHAQIAVIYQKMLEALQGYGLSQSDVDEILGYESKVTYTKRLDSIINGTPFVIEEVSGSTVISEPQPLQDVLPGEEDFLPDDTTLVNEQPIVEIPEAEESAVPEEPSAGETVVVGSNPVTTPQQDNGISYEEPIITGGQNVGNGSTNISSEVTGQNVVVGVR